MRLSLANLFNPIFEPGLKSPCKGFDFQTSVASAAMIGDAEGDVRVDVVGGVDGVKGVKARFRRFGDAGEG